jgi:hypothetical protein
MAQKPAGRAFRDAARHSERVPDSTSDVMIERRPGASVESEKIKEGKQRLRIFSGIYDTQNTHPRYVIYKLQKIF